MKNKNSIDLFSIIGSLILWLNRSPLQKSIPKFVLSLVVAMSMINVAWGQTKKAEIIGVSVGGKETVTVRIKAKDDQGKPVFDLQDTDFKLVVDDKPLEFASKDWKSPSETIPPPAYIIVLVDYSGSMQEQDRSGKKKINGALDAIRKFVEELASRCPKNSQVACPRPQVAIVPFGDPGDWGASCEKGFPVTEKNLGNFLPAGDFKLTNYINEYLAKQIPCAKTNLYGPMTEAVRFFADATSDTRFYLTDEQKNSGLREPRLSIVLLSDGFHNVGNREKGLEKLLNLLKRNENISVHTLGYGLTPQELGKKYNLGRPAKVSDISKNPELEREFVDRDSLAKIANATGGLAEFSPDAETVAEKLKLFMNALLGEYQISYRQPGAQRGSRHQVQVEVQSEPSNSKEYRMTVFGRYIPFKTRGFMLLGIVGLVGVGWIIPFVFWGKHLKEEAEGEG